MITNLNQSFEECLGIVILHKTDPETAVFEPVLSNLLESGIASYKQLEVHKLWLVLKIVCW